MSNLECTLARVVLSIQEPVFSLTDVYPLVNPFVKDKDTDRSSNAAAGLSVTYSGVPLGLPAVVVMRGISLVTCDLAPVGVFVLNLDLPHQYPGVNQDRRLLLGVSASTIRLKSEQLLER